MLPREAYRLLIRGCDLGRRGLREATAPIRGMARTPAPLIEGAAMREAPDIIQLSIQHYRGMLRLKSLAEELRPQVKKLLAEARAQLPLAKAEEFERMRKAGLLAVL
jgi:hypothetical protein